MATTTSSFNSLSIPAPEDTMDTSSPANRNLDDEDIDIDFEDYTGGVQVQDDERMLEDGDPMRPGTATDDVMVDDGEEAHVAIGEEVMQDDAAGQQLEEDEELIDYDEDDLQGQPVEDTVIPGVEEHPADVIDAATEEDVDEEIARSADDIAAEAPAPISAEQAEQILELPVTDEGSLNLTESTEGAAAMQTITKDEEQQHDSEHEAYTAYGEQEEHANQEDDQLTTQDHGTHPHIQVDTNFKVHDDAPDTPTDTGLHPMTIRYGDYHMPLFKSRRQPDGLLKDDNLASLSLAELVRNCRQQLAAKIGEEVSEDQEMILGFEHLGLMLVEVSKSATSHPVELR